MREIIGNTTATPNPRPDWEQTDPSKADYIKNKPEILTEDEIKNLVGDCAPQVQADWNQTDDTQVDYIKNKPEHGDVLKASIVNGVLVIEQNPHLVAKGEKGEQGEPGTPGAPGAPGQKGDSYVLTDADKAEIAASVFAQLPIAEEMSV